jgi:hypothetical protein
MSEQDAGSASLRKALIEWLRAAEAVLPDRDVPEVREVIFTTEGGITSGRAVNRPDFYRLVMLNSEALENLPEVDAILEVAHAYPQIGDVLLADIGAGRRQVENESSTLFVHHLLPFAADFFSRAHSARLKGAEAPDENAFEQTYDLFAQTVFRFETIPVQWLVQFDNLRLEIDDLEIEPGIRLRRATEQERNLANQVAFGSYASEPFHHNWVNVNPARLLETRDVAGIPSVFLEVADHRQFPRNRLSPKTTVHFATRMLNALRLVQPNDVGIHSIWYVDENPFGRVPYPRRIWQDPIASKPDAAQTVVTNDIERQVREIWPHLAEDQTDRSLVLALERLNTSYHRAKDEDRLIDYWVGLEALFLRVREQELRLRAALLTAQFITSERAERYPVFREIRASYDLRSWIVHGSELPSSERIRELTELTGNALRRSLHMCLPDRRPPDTDHILQNLLA